MDIKVSIVKSEIALRNKIAKLESLYKNIRDIKFAIGPEGEKYFMIIYTE